MEEAAGGAQEELAELLIDSARYGDTEDVRAALAQGADANAADEQGRTALHMAAANGHLAAMRALLDAGADVDAKNQEGNTPLHWACLNSQLPAVQLLLEAGAPVSALNSHARTPVDEVLGKECQDQLLALFDSFSAAAAGRQAAADARALGDPEDEEMVDMPPDAEGAEDAAGAGSYAAKPGSGSGGGQQVPSGPAQLQQEQ